MMTFEQKQIRLLRRELAHERLTLDCIVDSGLLPRGMTTKALRDTVRRGLRHGKKFAAKRKHQTTA